MSIKYLYNLKTFDTEQEAQAEVLKVKNRLENNPTDWVIVKSLEGNQESGWAISPTPLSDQDISNLDTQKKYQIFCPTNGINLFPLTSSEVEEKVLEFRVVYSNWLRAATILKLEKIEATETEPTRTIVTELSTSEDMSNYV